MNKRLAQFIEYKTGGSQKEFARLMGWSPQYLSKMLKGDSMGIQPVVSLLQKFPELNARWLILGEGGMVSGVAAGWLYRMFELERYIPVMTTAEVRELEAGRTDFDNDTVAGWKQRLAQRDSEIKARFDAAYKKQKEYADSNQSDYREAVL